MLTPWIDVNLPWCIRTSPTMRELNNKFVTLVKAAGDEWAKRWPDLAKLEVTHDDPADFSAVFETQDKHPWIRGHLIADNIFDWRDSSLRKVETEIQPELQAAYKTIVEHRYAYVLKNKFINGYPEVIRIQDEISQLRLKEHDQQFCNHPACAVGVLIDVRSSTPAGTSHTILLIGDVTPTGLDDGCCSTGLKDDDVIVRYRDLRPILSEACNG